MIKFEVIGKVLSKQRPRFFKGIAYTPTQTVTYENYIRVCYKQTTDKYYDIGQPVQLSVICYIEVPKSWTKKKQTLALEGKIRPTSKPDGDNIAKIVCDGLNKVAWHDDSQVVDIRVQKIYATQPKAIIQIWEVE